jgi:hypothetical protein
MLDPSSKAVRQPSDLADKHELLFGCFPNATVASRQRLLRMANQHTKHVLRHFPLLHRSFPEPIDRALAVPRNGIAVDPPRSDT